jgi:ankyrin repeat protein
VPFLEHQAAAPDAKHDREGRTVLHAAATAGEAEAMVVLVDMGADTSAVDARARPRRMSTGRRVEEVR